MNKSLKNELIKKYRLESISEEGLDLIVSIRFKEFGDMIKYLDNKINHEQRDKSR